MPNNPEGFELACPELISQLSLGHGSSKTTCQCKAWDGLCEKRVGIRFFVVPLGAFCSPYIARIYILLDAEIVTRFCSQRVHIPLHHPSLSISLFPLAPRLLYQCQAHFHPPPLLQFLIGLFRKPTAVLPSKKASQVANAVAGPTVTPLPRPPSQYNRCLFIVFCN